jgi:hypothetical protein
LVHVCGEALSSAFTNRVVKILLIGKPDRKSCKFFVKVEVMPSFAIWNDRSLTALQPLNGILPL